MNSVPGQGGTANLLGSLSAQQLAALSGVLGQNAFSQAQLAAITNTSLSSQLINALASVSQQQATLPVQNASAVVVESKAATSNGVSETVPDLTPASLPWPVGSPVMNVPHFDLATYCLVNLAVAPSRDVNGFDLPLADVTTLRFFFNLGVQHSRSLAATQLYQEKLAHLVVSSASPSVAQTAQVSLPQVPRVPGVGIQGRIAMEDEVSRGTADQQFYAIDSLYERFVQLMDDANQFLRNAGEVSAQYRPAEELADECKKAKALLHNMIPVLRDGAIYWVAVPIREVAKTELDKLRKPLDEVLAKPRRSTVDVKKDFDMITEEKKKADILKHEHRQLHSKTLDPESVYHDIYMEFIDVGAEQMKKEYDKVLNGMSAEIEDENLLCEAVDNFNTEMNAICDLLSRELTKENIENIEKFQLPTLLAQLAMLKEKKENIENIEKSQLPTLRAQLAMLKEKHDKANHARKFVDPHSSRFATLEDRMKSLHSMLEDSKKAIEKNEQERIAVIAVIAALLSQLKTLPILELLKLHKDILNEMENQLQKFPKDEADEFRRKIEELRDAKKDFDFLRGTSLTPVEDATAAFPAAQDIPQNDFSQVKNVKLAMDDTMCLRANCGRNLKVEVQVRDGPPGEALILTHSDAGYCEAKQKFCGFEWEAKPTINEDHVAVTLCCNPEVETDPWRCAALVTVYACVGVDDTTLLYRCSHVFHKDCRSTSIIAPHLELENDDTLALRDTSVEAAVRDSNFTKPSELSNACIAFKNSDMRVFVNKEYLLINSQKFATLFTAERAASAASNLDKSESGDDFDVLSSRASVPEQFLEDSGLNINLGDGVPSTAVCHEKEVFLLEDVNIKDFITFLETIYPPFRDITGENVGSVLPTAFRFEVEHIVKKCEIYLGTEDAKKLFDLLQRLLFATTYKLSSLQKDSLALLQNARDVLSLLDDPRLQQASSDLRSLLLETLLERFRSESRTATPEADVASTNSDF